jgi:hypothetical protein
LAYKRLVLYYSQSISLIGWLEFGKGTFLAEGPYPVLKPQDFGPGVFYRLIKGDGLMILAFGHFVSLLTKQTHNIVLANIFI